MTTIDDINLDQLDTEIKDILENNELSDEEKVRALLELQSPIMNEDRAGCLVLLNSGRQPTKGLFSQNALM